MGAVLEDLSPSALVAAIEANHLVLWTDSGRLPGGEVHDDPEALWAVSGVPFPLFNGVFRADLPADRLDQAVDALLARFRARNLPLQWTVGPGTRPAGLETCLLAHGGHHLFDTPGMAIDLGAPVPDTPFPPGAVIAEVEDETGLTAWAEAVAVGLELPDPVACAGWLRTVYAGVGLGGRGVARYRFFVAREAGVPVAASAVWLAEGVAGIGYVGTVPAARRRGLGSAMTVACLDAARAEGYRVAILWASPAGLPVYRRLGFAEYCTIGTYIWSP
jgi:GNAT superfamily N-acetyltransferase